MVTPPGMAVRAIRGAITVDSDEPCAVKAATRELLAAMVERNGLHGDDLVSAIFTVTHDLTSTFPARAAHDMGWTDVPLLCALEIPVPGALPRCVRVMLHATSDRPRSAIQHVYLHGAVVLRPDLVAPAPTPPATPRDVYRDPPVATHDA
ncbi:MAG TPA: chorismate mutase [Gemmatirosa sp.]